MKINPDKKTRELYSSMLPYGAQTEIANRIGTTSAAVCNFLKGRTNSWRIEKEVLKMIAREKKERESLLKAAGLL